MPGLAFDKSGVRVGYGAGYYDKFLKDIDMCIRKVAIAYDFQIFDSLPSDEYDVNINAIITPNYEIYV